MSIFGNVADDPNSPTNMPLTSPTMSEAPSLTSTLASSGGVTNEDVHKHITEVSAALTKGQSKLSKSLQDTLDKLNAAPPASPFGPEQIAALVDQIKDAFKGMGSRDKVQELILEPTCRVLDTWRFAADKSADLKKDIQKRMSFQFNVHLRGALQAAFELDAANHSKDDALDKRTIFLRAQEHEFQKQYNEPVLHVLVRNTFELAVQAALVNPDFAFFLSEHSAKEVGSTPFHIAVKENQSKILKALLDCLYRHRPTEMANILNATTTEGLTPLELAVFLDHEELVLQLLKFADDHGIKLVFKNAILFAAMQPPKRFPAFNSLKHIMERRIGREIVDTVRNPSTNETPLLQALIKADDVRKRLIDLEDALDDVDDLVSPGEGTNIETDPQRQGGWHQWLLKYLELAKMFVEVGKANVDAPNRLNNSKWCPTAKQFINVFFGQAKVKQYLAAKKNDGVVAQISSVLEDLTNLFNNKPTASSAAPFDAASMMP